MAWLQYDIKFRQMKAIRPEVAWDQREINIWHTEVTMGGTPGRQHPGGFHPQGTLQPFRAGGGAGGDRRELCR